MKQEECQVSAEFGKTYSHQRTKPQNRIPWLFSSICDSETLAEDILDDSGCHCSEESPTSQFVRKRISTYTQYKQISREESLTATFVSVNFSFSTQNKHNVNSSLYSFIVRVSRMVFSTPRCHHLKLVLRRTISPVEMPIGSFKYSWLLFPMKIHWAGTNQSTGVHIVVGVPGKLSYRVGVKSHPYSITHTDQKNSFTAQNHFTAHSFFFLNYLHLWMKGPSNSRSHTAGVHQESRTQHALFILARGTWHLGALRHISLS